MKRTLAIFSAALALGATARAATPEPRELPIPEQRTSYGWSEAQRIRYVNTPLIRKALAAINEEDYATAEDSLRKMLEHDPGNNHARVYLMTVYEKRGNPDDALAICEDLIRHYPDYFEPYVNKAFISYRAGKYEAAITSFETLLARAPADYPDRVVVVKNLAQLYFLTENYARAQYYGEAWLRAENSRAARLFLAECGIKSSNWDLARTHLDAALPDTPRGPERGELQMKRGFVLGNAGQFEDARVALEEAQEVIADKERRLEIEKQLGYNAMKEGVPFAAANHFKAYLLAHFDDGIAQAYLDALAASGQWDLAQLECKAYLQKPDLSPALRKAVLSNQLYAHQHLGDDAGFLRAALQLYKEFPEPRYLPEAAAAAQRLGRLDEAERLYRKYLDVAFDSETALNLHYLLKKRGELDESAGLLQRVADDRSADQKTRHAAMYELAQVERLRGNSDTYTALMGALIKENPESNFYHEYAVQLYGSGHYEDAAEMFIRSLPVETDPKVKFQTCKTIADIQLVLKQSNEAKSWLAEAAKHGEPDLDWQLGMARAEYQLEDFRACVDRLLPIAGQRDVFYLYLGFAFYRMEMPGLALYNLNRVAESEKLTARERYNLFANRAYLQFDQEQNEAALADIERALAYEYSPDLALVKVKTLTRLQRFKEAIAAGEELLKYQAAGPLTSEMLAMLDATSDPALREAVIELAAQPDAKQLADTALHIGLAGFRMKKYGDAIDYFTQALDLDPTQTDTLYLRGLCYFRQGKYKKAEDDFIAFYEKSLAAGSVPDNFWADLGVLEGYLGDYDLGTAALGHAVEIFPYDIDSVEASAYQYLQWHKNAEAQTNFQHVVRLYDDVTPHLEGKDANEYKENRAALRREYGFLDKTWGLQGYFSKTDFNDDLNTSLQTIDGALPSQAGILASYRPPEIGFRNQKTLDVYGRVLANFKDDSSWAFDGDSYQGGVGVLYKPLTSYNLNTSFERLFKIGDDAEDNWLWRTMYSWERGERPRKDADYWWYNKLYGEVSYFLEDERRWIYYLDGRLGLSLQLAPNLLLTVPQGLAIARYQSDDDDGLGTYAMLGLGGSLRLLQREEQYEASSYYLDAYGYYVWGWFEEQPDGLEQRDFEGVLFGVSFVK